MCAVLWILKGKKEKKFNIYWHTHFSGCTWRGTLQGTQRVGIFWVITFSGGEEQRMTVNNPRHPTFTNPWHVPTTHDMHPSGGRNDTWQSTTHSTQQSTTYETEPSWGMTRDFVTLWTLQGPWSLRAEHGSATSAI